jgi:quercetin dioxygenase-like cupin family protein
MTTYAPKIVPAGEGFLAVNPSEKAWIKLASAETGGQFLFVELEVEPGNGPPYHVHEREDELFYVLSGQVEFIVDGQRVTAGAGDTVFGARGVPHTFRGAGDGPARMTVIVTGSNFEAFYAAWERAAAEPDFDAAKGAALAEEYGLRFLPEPA